MTFGLEGDGIQDNREASQRCTHGSEAHRGEEGPATAPCAALRAVCGFLFLCVAILRSEETRSVMMPASGGGVRLVAPGRRPPGRRDTTEGQTTLHLIGAEDGTRGTVAACSSAIWNMSSRGAGVSVPSARRTATWISAPVVETETSSFSPA